MQGPSNQHRTVGDVMTRNPMTLPESASLAQAARAMRDSNIGAVLVCNGERLTGVVTDRDIVVRAIADGQNPNDIPLSRVLSEATHYLDPSAELDDAIELMGKNYVRRIPVVEDGKPVGIVSLGDLAMLRDPDSTLGRISTAPSNQ